jgi:hypothetical protein
MVNVGEFLTTKSTKKERSAVKMKFDELSSRVIGCAIEVHRALGPGQRSTPPRGSASPMSLR